MFSLCFEMYCNFELLNVERVSWDQSNVLIIKTDNKRGQKLELHCVSWFDTATVGQNNRPTARAEY